MKVKEIVAKLDLKVYSGNNGLENDVNSGYTSDLLSDVMGNAKSESAWITLQTHKNIMAVASLKDISVIILVKGLEPAKDTIEQSNEEGLPILGSSENAFELSAKLYNLLNNE